LPKGVEVRVLSGVPFGDNMTFPVHFLVIDAKTNSVIGSHVVEFENAIQAMNGIGNMKKSLATSAAARVNITKLYADLDPFGYQS
jgi:hypothetical protein